MKDATITQEQSILRERFPSVVTTDDLIFELGKKDVDRLNKEKLLEGILKKSQKAESQMVNANQIKVDSEKQVASLESSNKLFEENNSELSNELTRVRQELAGEITKNTQLVSSFNKEKAQLTEQYEGKLEELALELEEAKKPKKRKFRKKKING